MTYLLSSRTESVELELERMERRGASDLEESTEALVEVFDINTDAYAGKED